MINPQRGEIWFVDLDPTRGSEQSKIRLCVVISPSQVSRLPVRIVISVTGWNPRYERYIWMVRLNPDGNNGLTKVSAADCLQIRTVDLVRFNDRIGRLPDLLTERVAAVVSYCVGHNGNLP